MAHPLQYPGIQSFSSTSCPQSERETRFYLIYIIRGGQRVETTRRGKNIGFTRARNSIGQDRVSVKGVACGARVCFERRYVCPPFILVTWHSRKIKRLPRNPSLSLYIPWDVELRSETKDGKRQYKKAGGTGEGKREKLRQKATWENRKIKKA